MTLHIIQDPYPEEQHFVVKLVGGKAILIEDSHGRKPPRGGVLFNSGPKIIRSVWSEVTQDHKGLRHMAN